MKAEIESLSSEFTEIAIDSLLKDGIFKDIPIISSLLSAGKLIKSISDALLLNRILAFVKELNLKNQTEINTLKEKYFKDEHYSQIGSKILFVLERADDQLKIKWLATSFRLFLDKKINRSDFLRLTSIINNTYVSDVVNIIAFTKQSNITSNNQIIKPYMLDHMFSIGLLENLGIDGGDSSGDNSGTIYGLNEFGKIFLNMIIKSEC